MVLKTGNISWLFPGGREGVGGKISLDRWRRRLKPDFLELTKVGVRHCVNTGEISR